MSEVIVLNRASLLQLGLEEGKKFGIFVIILYAFFQIFYWKDNVWNIMLMIIGQLYLFIIPGFVLMLYFRDKISFIYRLLMGIGLGYSSNILVTYYLNLLIKVNISKFYYFIPLVLMAIGIVLLLIKKEEKASTEENNEHITPKLN